MSLLILGLTLLLRAFLPFSYRCLLKVPLVLSFQGKNVKTYFHTLAFVEGRLDGLFRRKGIGTGIGEREVHFCRLCGAEITI